MIVLSFDQSLTSTAYALLDFAEGRKCKLVTAAKASPLTKGISRLSEYKNYFERLVAELKPDVIVRELHNQIQFGYAKGILSLGTIIDLICYDKKFVERKSYIHVPATVWKKYVFGSGNRKKDTSYMLVMNECFQKSKDIDLGGIVVKSDDIGDAISIGLTGGLAYQLKKSGKLESSTLKSVIFAE